MPIELAPLPEPCGQDASQAQTRGDGMYWIVDDQIPESALGLRDHEDWIWQHIPTGRDVVIVDVGAFVGTFSVWASRRCGKVIACEPHPRHHVLLKRNLKLNGCENVVPLETAVGDIVAQVSMGNPDLAAQVIAKYGVGMTMQVSYEPGDIQQSTLDDLLEAEARVDCIKIDVEGAEVRVIQGALATLRKHRPLLLIEALRPDVLVKGPDYAGRECCGAEVVESYGGRVVIPDWPVQHSSTRLIERILANGVTFDG